jgi:hypothetical protein
VEGAVEEKVLPALTKRKIHQIVTMMHSHFDVSVSEEELMSLLNRAYIEAGGIFDVSDAEKWGGDCQFPPDVCSRDEERLRRAGGNLSAMVSALHAETRTKRLSEERVRRMVPSNHVEFKRLLDLAQGIVVGTSDDFEPNGLTPFPLRTKYMEVASAVNRMMMESFISDKILLLPTAVAREIPGIHYSPASWAPKHGKPKGRPITDCSNAPSGSSLNDSLGEARNLAKERYGAIELPTIESISLMILTAVARWGWKDLVLWKMDLSGAFTLLDIHPDSVRLLAVELTNGLTAIHHTGCFGWTGLPFAFGVISRVLEYLIGQLITGFCVIYVDDIIGVSPKGTVQSDLSNARKTATGLLGPDAIAEDKTEVGRVLTFIGWSFNLDTETVSLGDKNLLRTLHDFFDVTVDQPVKVSMIHRLASLASRYAKVCRIMRVFVGQLFCDIAGMSNENASVMLLPASVAVIQLWRTILSLVELRGVQFQRKISSFQSKTAAVTLAYDASLTGAGVALYLLQNNEWILWKVTSVVFPFDLAGDASFQNTCEFIAIVIGFVMLARLGRNGVSIHLQGDSIASLTWSAKERFRGRNNRRAALVYILTGLRFDLSVHEENVEHVPGINNQFCDDLSRGVAVSHVAPSQWFVWPSTTYDSLLTLCNPLLALESGQDVTTLWTGVTHMFDAWESRN